MPGIQFQEDTLNAPELHEDGQDFTGKLVSWGFASTRRKAEYLLIAVAILALTGAFFAYEKSKPPEIRIAPGTIFPAPN